jgi:hypothetical protein
MAKFLLKNHVCIFKKKYKKIQKNIAWFSIPKNNYKKVCFACIMDLIRSLLKPRGHDLNFKNTKRIIYLFLISKIMNLYVRCISDIKRNKCKKICFGFRMARYDRKVISQLIGVDLLWPINIPMIKKTHQSLNYNHTNE